MAKDPVFGLDTPLVFAHRGGAGEVAESTEQGFRHAMQLGVDVLELDVNVTRDGKIVVWHGPELDNVYIGTELLKGRSIRDLDWPDLADAYVVDPRHRKDRSPEPQRKLLLLRDFIDLVHDVEDAQGRSLPIGWNLEIKGKAGCWKDAFAELLRRLNAEVGQRRIVLAAAREEAAQSLRRAVEESNPPAAYAFNLTAEQQLAYRRWFRLDVGRSLLAGVLGPFFAAREKGSLSGYTLETSHAVVGPRLVKEVHARGGAVHAFLTKFPVLSPGVDDKPDAELRRELDRLLATEVDGIMTDYPARVVAMLKQRRREGFESEARPSPGAP